MEDALPQMNRTSVWPILSWLNKSRSELHASKGRWSDQQMSHLFTNWPITYSFIILSLSPHTHLKANLQIQIQLQLLRWRPTRTLIISPTPENHSDRRKPTNTKRKIKELPMFAEKNPRLRLILSRLVSLMRW